MKFPVWSRMVFLFLLVSLFSVNVFAQSQDVSASHGDEGDPTEIERRAIALVVDAEPTLASVHEPNVPDDCWTIQEFPYTRDAFFERKAECVEPWISTHQMFTFEVEAGGTYVLWNELLAPGMPAQFFPPTTEVFVELHGENRWLGMNAPLVDIENTTYGHLQSNPWVRDISVLERWGWDDEVHIDYRTPDEEGIRNRIAYAFTAEKDGIWRFSAGGTNPLPPGTRESGDNLRVWIQRLDGVTAESTVFVFERFEYPPANELVIEHGATVFRDFELLERDTNEPATNVSVTLSPTGTCSSLDPGQMRCTIETSQILPGPQQFRFTSATHNGEPESTADWLTFGFTTVDRDIKTKAEMTLDAKAKGQIVAGVFVTGESGLGIEFHEDGSMTLDSGEAVALGVASDVGVGAGIKLGWVSPRAKAEIEGEIDIKAFESVAIDITDTNNSDQQIALGAFLFDKLVSLGTIATGEPIDAVLDTFREDVLEDQFKQFITADEFGVAASANLTGKIGAWTGNRPGLGQFNYGLGSTAGGSISASWKFDKKSGEHAIIVQFSTKAAGVFNPTVWPIYFEGEEIAYSVTGGVNVEVTLGFSGFPSEDQLKTVTVEIKGGTTWEERIDSGSISITFDAKDLRDAGNDIINQLLALADPRNNGEFSEAVLTEVFGEALKDVEGTLVVKQSRGTGFKPALEAGAEVLAFVSVSGEVEVGGDWRLVVTQKTQDWRLLEDSDGRRGLVQIAEFPFESTSASETQFTDIVGPMIAQGLGTALVSPQFGAWVREQWESGRDVTLDASNERTETALLDFSGDDRTVRNRLGGEITALEIGVRTWFNLILPDWVVPGGSLETPQKPENFQVGFSTGAQRQSSTPSFFASEFMDVGPAGTNVDPPVEISLSYLTDPSDPQLLRMYRYTGGGVWTPLPTEVDATERVATAQVSEFGTFVVGFDTTAPEIVPIQTTTGFTAVVEDSGSGVDAESISLTVDGESVEAVYDSATQTIVPASPIDDGAAVVVAVSDTAGNEATHASEANELPSEESSGTSAGSNGTGTAQPTSTAQTIFNPGSGNGEEDTGGGSPILIIVLVVLLALAAAGVGAFFVIQRQRPPRQA